MLRGFTDSFGTDWRVWEVFPSKGVNATPADSLSSLSMTPFANGWLCFESLSEKRRLAPIPDGWADREVKELEALCGHAELVPVRRKRTSGPRLAQRSAEL